MKRPRFVQLCAGTGRNDDGQPRPILALDEEGRVWAYQAGRLTYRRNDGYMGKTDRGAWVRIEADAWLEYSIHPATNFLQIEVSDD